MTHSFLVRAAVAIGTFSATPAQAVQRQPAAVPSALQWTEGQIFQIKTQTSGDTEVGTAVLLTEANGIGVFATCYHVMKGATGFEIRDRDGIDGVVAASTQPGTCYYRCWNQDLVLLRVKMQNAKGRRRPVFPTEDQARTARTVALPAANDLREVRGWAVGYPFATDRKPIAVKVRMQAARQMAALGLFRPDAREDAPKDGDDADLTVGRAGILSRELTFPGMSGGSVMDEEGRFGGLLFGRGSGPLGLVGLIVPAKDVLESLRRAEGNNEKAWQPFAAKGFTSPVPFRLDVPQSAAPKKWVNNLDWTSLDRWIAVFQNRPSIALTRFQEVSVNLGELRRVATYLAVANPNGSISLRETPAEENEQSANTAILLNGRRLTLGTDRTVGLNLTSGENLLVLSRTAPGGNVVANDLFKPIRLATDICVDGKPVMTIRRTLPAAIRGFSVFITLTDDNLPTPDLRPANGRLAVRLDELSRLLARIPMSLPVDVKDDRGSFVHGAASVQEGNAIRLSFLSEQTLGVCVDATIKIDRARANLPFIQVSVRNKTLHGQLSGRLQFSRRGDDFSFLSARVQGMDSSDTVLVRLPVMIEADVRPNGAVTPPPRQPAAAPEGLDFDLSGALRLGLICFLNNQLLRPSEENAPPLIQARQFLARTAPIEVIPGWKINPGEFMLRKADDGSEWLVFTFRLEMGDHFTELKPGDLMPPPDRLATTAMELFIRDVPAAAGRRYLALFGSPLNPLVARPLDPDGRGPVASDLRVRVGLGKILGPSLDRPVTFPDRENRLPEALRAMIDATLAQRPFELEAALHPEAAVLALRHILPEKYLRSLKAKGEGRLRLTCQRDEKIATVTLEGDGKSFMLTGMGELKLPEGIEITDPALTFTSAKLTGDIVGKTVKGTVKGRLSCAQVAFAGRSLYARDKDNSVGCSFRACLNTSLPEPLTAQINELKAMYQAKSGQKVPVPPDSFKVWVETKPGKPARVGTDFLIQMLGD